MNQQKGGSFEPNELPPPQDPPLKVGTLCSQVGVQLSERAQSRGR